MFNKPIITLFLLPNAFFLALFFSLSEKELINIINAALFAVALGVCTAYFPIARDLILRKRNMDSADWLGLGVFCNWSALAGIRIWSFSWRWVGTPHSWNDSQILSYLLFLSCCGGMFHLVATQAIDNRMPKRSWVIMGAWVTAVVFTLMMINIIITDRLAP